MSNRCSRCGYEYKVKSMPPHTLYPIAWLTESEAWAAGYCRSVCRDIDEQEQASASEGVAELGEIG